MRTFNRARSHAYVALAALVVAALGLAPAAQATFPGENGKLAFGSRADPFGTNPELNLELFTMNPDGSGLRQLTFTGRLPSGAGITNWVPDWSPDGTRIAFRTDRDGNNEIYVINADGSDPRRLTDDPASDDLPSWSADGSKLYFYSTRSGNADVYLMNADGSGLVNMTNHPAHDARAVESPDGSTIAFTSTRSGHLAVYTMDASGGHVRQLTPDAFEAATPSWSPDGRMIAFNDNFCATCPASDIWLMSRNGSGLRRLTHDFGNNLYPSWSPDGEQISFTHWADLTFPPPDIYRVEADGTGAPINITSSAGVKGAFSAWQPLPDGD